MRRTAHLLLSFALALVSACSHPRSADGTSRSTADVITASDIRSTTFTNVYDIVAQFHFRWLQARGTDTVNLQPGNVMVRLDDNELGTVQALRTLTPAAITSIRFVDPISAAGRWGLGYAHGAIVISTRVER